jgi:hypothetical protein
MDILKSKLNKRERYIIIIAACFIALFIIFNVLLKFQRQKAVYIAGTQKKEQDLQTLTLLGSEYRTYLKDYNEVKAMLTKREKGFTLNSFLDKAAKETEVRNNVENIKQMESTDAGAYKEVIWEIKLNDINTGQLVKFLYRVEGVEDLIFIKQIIINDDKKQPGLLDCTVRVLSYEEQNRPAA